MSNSVAKMQERVSSSPSETVFIEELLERDGSELSQDAAQKLNSLQCDCGEAHLSVVDLQHGSGCERHLFDSGTGFMIAQLNPDNPLGFEIRDEYRIRLSVNILGVGVKLLPNHCEDQPICAINTSALTASNIAGALPLVTHEENLETAGESELENIVSALAISALQKVTLLGMGTTNQVLRRYQLGHGYEEINDALMQATDLHQTAQQERTVLA